MGSDGDPYLYPGTTTLKNRYGLRDRVSLERVQDDLAAERYSDLMRNLPKLPFTFETLKDIHRHLFGDIYEWAGEPRTISISKAEWNVPNSRMATFVEPAAIPGMARVVFNITNQAAHS